MKVSVDAALCCGYTICAEICPEVFVLDEDGFASTRMDEVPAPLQDRAAEAARACPQHAITITSEQGA